MARGGSALAKDRVAQLIDRVAGSSEVGIFVGAGISIEAGLPSWNGLIKRLLREVATETQPFRRAGANGDLAPELADEFASRTITGLGPLGAAAVVKAHFGSSYGSRVKAALYEGAHDLKPGPTAVSIARLAVRTDALDGLPILTTNFDPLLELALKKELGLAGRDPSLVKSVLPGRELEPKALNVVHLHGLISHPDLDGFSDSREIVLAEDEFLTPTVEREQARRVAEDSLSKAPYLFLGASLTDVNVLSHLYSVTSGTAGRRHAAVAISQQAAVDIDPEAAQVVVEALESTAARRLRAAGVEVAFVDTYSEASQFVCEVDLRRTAEAEGKTDGYSASSYRWAERARRFEQRALSVGLLPARGREREFKRLQKRLRKVLSVGVDAIDERFKEVPAFQSEEEQLALHLWMHAPVERLLTMVAQSDRKLYNPATLQVARSVLPSSYLVVEALCNGTVVEARGQGLRSARWGSMIAVPFIVTDSSESVGSARASMPAGVMVLASTSIEDAGLKRLRARPEARVRMIAAINRLGTTMGEHLIAIAPELNAAASTLDHIEPEGFLRGRTGKTESGPQRIGPETHIEGSPPVGVEPEEWETLIPSDRIARLGG